MVQQRVPLEVRQHQLVETALGIAEREGPAAVTARRVASEAGVSLGVVHYCFASTTDLAARMATHLIEQLADVALPALEPVADPTDIGSLLRQAVTAVWTQVEASATRQLLTYELTTTAVRTPSMAPVTQRLYEVSDAAATQILQHAAAVAGRTWDVELPQLARLTVMAIDGATLRWLTDGDSERALLSLFHVVDLLARSSRVATGASPAPGTS